MMIFAANNDFHFFILNRSLSGVYM